MGVGACENNWCWSAQFKSEKNYLCRFRCTGRFGAEGCPSRSSGGKQQHLILQCSKNQNLECSGGTLLFGNSSREKNTTTMGRDKTTAVLLLLLAVTASTFSYTSCTPEEGVALSVMMTQWKVTFPTWIAGTDPCDGWENVRCIDGRVTYLNLTSTGISGGLPKEIGVLSALDTLVLSENNLHGELPDELALCENLRYLDISDNDWDIDFPAVLLRFSKLESLYASTAALQGRIPKEFYNMISLKYLYLGNNTQLTGKLEDFCQLTNMVNLTVWSMKFEDDQLPEKLSLLTKLQYFSCHDCGLVGGLPESYGNLQNLVDFNVRRNSLTGGIPDSYKKLTKMYNFRVDTNFLLGPFPNWMFDLWPNLTYLYLSRNQLYGTPYNITYLETNFDITSFRVLRWDCNYLRGPQPCSARGNNNCSATTSGYMENPVENVARFVFDPNCYDDVTSTDYLQQVSYCGAHPLQCAPFYSTVVEQNICPVCPQGQDPVLGSTVADGCLCGARTDSGPGISVGTIVGIVVGVTVLFSVILVFVIWKRRKQFSFLDIFSNKQEDFDENWEVPPGVHRFTVDELAKITSDFDDSHIIGAGGFGKVYSGTLEDGRMVAIKRASAGSLQGHAEFRNEVTLLSRLHHRHLVKLEGFCAEKDFQVLVYEFMMNGNLATHLYGDQGKGGATKIKEGSFTPMPWYKRLEIACGVARGLEYLHSFAAPSVIHRDVKPSNILLDENMVAKLADFGISREFEVSNSKDTHLSTRPAGTAGYLDPEYFLRRQLTTASDVYAFGVVLLELVTGQVAIDHQREDEYNLIEWAKKRFRTAGIIAIVDARIADDYSKDAFTQMTELGLRCSSFSKHERPTMKEVLAALEPLLPKTTKSTTSRSDSSFTETDWLLAKRELYHKLDINTSGTDIYSQAETGSDLAPTLNVLDMSQAFGPR